ncbi:MAG: DNA gyrase inhibitor YacG [Deltaproteobacteria bacterium]|nr:DNA gyrase inhibitor YacG [Deltaproteobacteria bacterium]
MHEKNILNFGGRKKIIIACPICGKTVDWGQSPDRPFCSPRCRLIDLGNWSGEEYRIPSKEPIPPENEPALQTDPER